MKHIRLRIIDLIDQHSDSFDKCPGCAACTEIERLRNILDREPEDKFKHILDKGQDMTKSDIAFLLENEVGKISIKKALKMDSTGFLKMMTNLGFTKRRQQKEEIKVGKLEMTAEEFVDLKYKQNLSFVQIAKLKGVSDPTVHHWKDRHKDKIQKAFNALNLPAKEEKKTSAAIAPQEPKQPVTAEYRVPKFEPIQKPIQPEKTEKQKDHSNCLKGEEKAEYERLIAALRNDLNDAHKQLDEKDENLRNLEQAHVTYVGKAKEEQERLISEAQELEQKLRVLQETSKQMNHDYYLEALKKIEPLEEENQSLRETEKELHESIRIYRAQLEDAEKTLRDTEDEYHTLRWLIKKWA